MKRRALLLAFLALLLTTSCQQSDTTAEAALPKDHAALAPALAAIKGDEILQNIKVLASDEYEGRAPGTKGEDLTVKYLTDQYQSYGLKPGNPDGTYIQKVPLVGITPNQDMTLTFKSGAKTAQLKLKDDVVAWTKRVVDSVSLDNSDMVFVGYGVVAPEYNWDDYKGTDVKGKVLVMLVNDPPVPDPQDTNKLDPKTFGGKAMTYYGRWTYKYEIGAKLGAAGVLIVHETIPAGYPFSVVANKIGEQFDLVTPDKNMSRCQVEGWITSDQAKNLFSMSGKDFDTLKKQAASRDFKPVPLGTTASVTINNKLRFIDSRNVVAKLEGSDPTLKNEYVIYTAHWDHLGVGTPNAKGDKIYNGAIDNASGSAGLLQLAKAYTKLATPPKRSILFLSVTSEEQGLLGSQYYSVAPLYPLAKTLANINMDELNVHGKTADVTIVGLGNSDLDDITREAAAEQGRVLRPDATPEKGSYYRSDHFNFAKQGVPALDPNQGIQYIGKPEDYGEKVLEDFEANDYHQPSDEVRPDWDLSGAVQDLQLFLTIGYRVAQGDKYPAWKPGTEFKATREAQLKAAK